MLICDALISIPINGARKHRTPLKTPFVTQLIEQRMIQKVWKVQMKKKTNTYVKLWHDSDMKASERCVQLSDTLVTNATYDPLDEWNMKEIARTDENGYKDVFNWKTCFSWNGIPQVRSQCQGHKVKFLKKI